MKHNETITNWIVGLGNGDERAVEIMFNKYFERLIRLAVRKMHGLDCVARSGEDIAISAIKSLCFRARDKELSIENENDLWSCLFRITTRKACAERRKSFAVRRGSNKPLVSGLQTGDDSDDAIFNYVAGREPPPELALQLAENADELLNLFRESSTQYSIASLKLQGFSIQEIADKVGLMPRTIFWHLSQMQHKWELFNLWEYLVDNLFDGFPLDQLAESMDWEPRSLTAIVEKMLELWHLETGNQAECDALRLRFFQPDEFERLWKSGLKSALDVEKKSGFLRRNWLNLVFTTWKPELEATMKKVNVSLENENK